MRVGPVSSLGFTGTRKGMTQPQYIMVSQILADLKPLEVHHGDCVGADEQFHDMAFNLIINDTRPQIIIHPSTHHLRAHKDGDEVFDEKPPLERNRDIVAASAVMIAAPPPKTDHSRGGTWYTINTAIRVKVPIVIVYSDGMYEWK